MPFLIRSLVGQVFNGIKVLSIHTYGVGVRTKWLSMCHCGNMFVVDGSFLKNGHTQSCGCIRDKIIDLVGSKFGKLTVVSLSDRSKPAKWNCVCECGKECIVIGSSLKNGGTRSCGCLLKQKKPNRCVNIAGKKFGMLTAIKRDDSNNQKWICKCECGKEKSIHQSNFKNGHTRSCGCYNLKALSINKRTHGMAADHYRIYQIWRGMLRRCYDAEDAGYEVYGGRGIYICDQWRFDCAAFVKWSLNNGYDEKLTIDRIDNDDIYKPDNCRWATKLQQAQNTSRTLGEEKVKEICKLLKSGLKQIEIAKMYNVDNSTISEINTGKTYSHITSTSISNLKSPH